MASSSSKTKGKNNNRRWTEDELNILAEVLADEANQFCSSLEKLALKKAANNEVFEHILTELNKTMCDESSLKFNKNGKKKIDKLDLCIEKLRVKYKWLKSEWLAKTKRAKNKKLVSVTSLGLALRAGDYRYLECVEKAIRVDCGKPS